MQMKHTKCNVSVVLTTLNTSTAIHCSSCSFHLKDLKDTRHHKPLHQPNENFNLAASKQNRVL